MGERKLTEKELDIVIEGLADNAMLKHRKELYYEWDFEKNDELGLDVFKITYGSNKKAWWNCHECGSEYDTIINKKAINKFKCPYCSGNRVNHTNSLSTVNPSLVKEWNFEKNKNITPYDITGKSGKRVWWTCPNCKSDYDMKVRSRADGENCPYCRGYRVNSTNSLESLNPELAQQWHPNKNNILPSEVTQNSGKKVWWVGACGHEWDATVSHRTNGRGCPYCANGRVKVLKGFNDLWTTDKRAAKFLLNPKDGYTATKFSRKKFDWKCFECGFILKNFSVQNMSLRVNKCHICSDGMSYPEKFMTSVFKQLKINFETQKSFNWSEGRIYDFYLPSLNVVIETHGEQHYTQTLERIKGARTLEEEKENDIFKKTIAKRNGVDAYIVINCQFSDEDWIKNNIKKSKLQNILDLNIINWSNCHEYALSSLVKKSSSLWNEGMRSAIDIAKVIGVSRVTSRAYLKQAAELGWCDYNPKTVLSDRSRQLGKSRGRPIIQLTLEGEPIREWKSGAEASRQLNIHSTGIYNTANGKANHCGGFKWEYKESCT